MMGPLLVRDSVEVCACNLLKVLSTFLFLGLLGGGAFLWLKLSSNDKSDGGDSGDALQGMCAAEREREKHSIMPANKAD